MGKLAEFKTKMSVRAMAVYMDRADDLEPTHTDYQSHFEDLGSWLLDIKLIKDLPELVNKISANEFAQIGIFAEDLEDFLFEK